MSRGMKHLLFVTSVFLFLVCPASVLPDAGHSLFVNEVMQPTSRHSKTLSRIRGSATNAASTTRLSNVTISCSTPDAMIYYTTDGSEPYQQGGRVPTGTVYTQPIRIAKTTCLRAMAVKQGWVSSPLQTQTYLFARQRPPAVGPARPASRPTGRGWPPTMRWTRTSCRIRNMARSSKRPCCRSPRCPWS